MISLYKFGLCVKRLIQMHRQMVAVLKTACCVCNKLETAAATYVFLLRVFTTE